MSIESRVSKLEVAIGRDESVCCCPDAVSLIGTPLRKICFKCGKAINTSTWENWRVFYPDVKSNFFAFGMMRDDSLELVNEPNSYFLSSLSGLELERLKA